MGEAYWVAEQTFIRIAKKWTILRMSYFAQTMAEELQISLNANVLTGLGEEREAYVSRNDVAAAASALSGEARSGEIYNLTGPARITGIKRAASVSKIVGKPISYVTITMDQLRAGLAQAGLPEPVIDAVAEVKTNFIESKFDIVMGDVARLSGHQPKPLSDILAAELA